MALTIGFILLLVSILINYQALQENSKMLKHLSRDQIKLNFYTHQLNYSIKKNQAYLLQTIILGQDDTGNRKESLLIEIKDSVEKLEKFLSAKQYSTAQFRDILSTLKKRVISYKLVQDSLLEAIKSTDKEDIDDAILGFNAISVKFSSESALLIDITNEVLYKNIIQLNENNDRSSHILLLSFLFTIILVLFSVMKFSSLHKILQLQLTRATDAENNLKNIQKQLLRYNDDLEEEISKKTKEIHQKIYTHFLSGLPNRNKLLEDIANFSFEQIAILNIDKFQSFNDVYGEEVGNIAISLSAKFLTDNIDTNDMLLYHLGGDEFVIVSMKGNLSQESFIRKIETILQKYRLSTFAHEDKTFQFIMSSGISFSGKKKILAYADMALKDAKKRNTQLAIFHEDKALEKHHKDDMSCSKKLVFALSNDALISYFQPIVPIQDTSKAIKYESLVRIRDQDGKIIPPFSFIRVAKQNRIYYKITNRVIENTLSTIEKYKVPCSLNISLIDIENARSMEKFFYTLDNFKYNELLTVELLETEEFKDYKTVYDFCVKVRSYGAKVALDDFGAGYSNFSHILKLPVDYIKIDASLISNIDRDRNSQIMVETIVELAQKLHIQTIAEFVSSKEILDVLKEVGVDYAQGFYLGKPEPIENHIGVEVKKS